MKGDRLDCPFCGYPYGEEEMEAKIWKNFKCEKCYKKIKVFYRNGLIKLGKRECRMVYYTKMLEQQKDFKYMYSILKSCIFHTTKSYDRQQEQVFFKSGGLYWVCEARRMFCEECNVVSISHNVIIAFFKANEGKIDARTIKLYSKN